MKKYLLLAGVGFCCVSGAAWAAIDCTTPPSCAEMGYTMTADDCDGRDTLKCPFNLSEVYCSNPWTAADKCIAAGYDRTSGACAAGKTKEACPYDGSYFMCTGEGISPGPIGPVQPAEGTCSEINSNYFTANRGCGCEYGYISAGITGSDGACYKCGTRTDCVGPNGASKCPSCTTNPSAPSTI